MQQFQALIYTSDIQNKNLYEAIATYQTALAILISKLHANPILYEVHNNILTRFLSENANVFLNKLKQSECSSDVNNFQNIYNEMLKLSNDSLNAWHRSNINFLQSFCTKTHEKHEPINFLNAMQSYNKDILKIIQENVSRTLDDYIQDSNPTASFLYNEFNKVFDSKNIPFLNDELLKNKSYENLLKGAKMFLHDVQSSPNGYFIINTVNANAFELGKNIAATPGKVVFQNELLQLICYDNVSETVYKTPIFIVTAWINKYYILDLEYSYVKWLVNNGYRVFITSWVNPTESMRNENLASYLQNGLLAALSAVKELSHSNEVNCIGYCMGGTLLAIAAAYLSTKGMKDIKSITLLTTLTDFERCGPVKMFITNEMLKTIESHMEKQGYISGYDMFSTFSILKSSDMMWYYFVNKYVLGKEVSAIDVLYWNADSTRIPYALHKDCLRHLYQNNLLASGKLELSNEKIDLSAIKCPIYFFATEDDHIAPWQSVYKGLNLCKNSTNKRFILSKSGHVAAVINHPNKNKYGYWSNDSKQNKKMSDNPNEWLNTAQYNIGSWWNDWHNWMQSYNGEKIPLIPIPPEKIIENAPGSYVKVT